MRRLPPSGRPPVVPLIDTSYAARCLGVPVSECFLNPCLHARALARALERHPGIDGLSINIGLTPGMIREQERTVEGRRIRPVDGVEWFQPWDDIGTPSRHEVTSFSDARLRGPNIFREHIAATLRAIPEKILRGYHISAGLTGPYSQVVFTVGLERALDAITGEPEALLAAVRARVRYTLEWAEELAGLGAASVWIGEGFASNSLISPRQYETFVMPFQRMVAGRLRELGVPSVVHICGKAEKMLERIAATGADCFEADWPVDVAGAQRRIGDRMALKGNLHTTRLLEASAEEIYRESLALLRAAWPGGGFILSSGCALGRDTPPANVDAMARAARDFEAG